MSKSSTYTRGNSFRHSNILSTPQNKGNTLLSYIGLALQKADALAVFLSTSIH
jgi:hypothetical protein